MVLAAVFLVIKSLPMTIGAFPIVALSVLVGGVCYALTSALLRESTMIRMLMAGRKMVVKVCRRK